MGLPIFTQEHGPARSVASITVGLPGAFPPGAGRAWVVAFTAEAVEDTGETFARHGNCDFKNGEEHEDTDDSDFDAAPMELGRSTCCRGSIGS